MKTLPVAPIPIKEYAGFSKEIEKAIKTIYLEPLRDSLKKVELKNAAYNSPLSHVLEDIAKGVIYYKNGRLYGSFRAVTSNELKKAGYVWSNGSFQVNLHSSPDIASAVSVKRQEDIEKAEALLLLLLLLRKKNKKQDVVKIDKHGEKVREFIEKKIIDVTPQRYIQITSPLPVPDKKLEKALVETRKDVQAIQKGLEVKTKQKIEEELKTSVTDEIYKSINEEISESIEYFVESRLEQLEKDVNKIVAEGTNIQEKLEARIEKEKSITQHKAEYLSLRTLNLVRTEVTKQEAIKLGKNKYRWITKGDDRVRPANKYQKKMGENHRYLHNTIQSWDSPPITNLVTGHTAHPAEDHGCRCVAQIVLDD